MIYYAIVVILIFTWYVKAWLASPNVYDRYRSAEGKVVIILDISGGLIRFSDYEGTVIMSRKLFLNKFTKV